MHDANLKNNVIRLRKEGKSYGEIIKLVSKRLPKSTISGWCQNIILTNLQKSRIDRRMTKGMRTALLVNRERRKEYLKSINDRVSHMPQMMMDKNVSKLIVAMLYLGEGSKNTSGAAVFANSNPMIISLFLRLLRFCYKIDESKFRCTLQCRADQNVEKLERFWCNITEIPRKQFYKARVDPRTLGKPSRKKDYKGVCKIDYFSADLFLELMEIAKVICNGPIT